MSLPRGHAFATVLLLSASLSAAVAGAWLAFFRAPSYEEPDLPPAYAGRANPLAGDSAAAAEGARLFREKSCTACHGAHADGRGPSARGLNPAPADLAAGTLQKNHSDAWFYWRISEGKHGTAMPRWDGVLEERQRWAIVSYIRSLEK